MTELQPTQEVIDLTVSSPTAKYESHRISLPKSHQDLQEHRKRRKKIRESSADSYKEPSRRKARDDSADSYKKSGQRKIRENSPDLYRVPRRRNTRDRSDESYKEPRSRKAKQYSDSNPHEESNDLHPPRSLRSKKDSSSQLNHDMADVFYIDLEAAPLPSGAQIIVSPNPEEKEGNASLLLPAHVSVFGATSVEILAPPVSDSEESTYIEYLDYDDRKDLVRYFESPADGAIKPTRTICKNCGAEGEHKTSTCPVLICLTCGARDEHFTRSCPISKTCYTCGMKGHINSTCPNRNAAPKNTTQYHDCGRCGSLAHKTNECPTQWRLYDYLSTREKDDIIRTRQNKKNLELGQGGEGYIADDEWCYNCGSWGHWGDDCNEIPHKEDLPEEPSAFSTHNLLAGPFATSNLKQLESSSRRRGPSDREYSRQSDIISKEWDTSAPEHVGRQGKRKNMVKLEKKAQELEGNDNDDDWFGNRASTHRMGGVKSSELNTARKLKFGASVKDSERHFQPRPSAPSLLDRLGDVYQDPNSRNQEHTDSSRPRSSRYKRERTNYPRDNGNRSFTRERDRDVGPRYNGGYSR